MTSAGAAPDCWGTATNAAAPAATSRWVRTPAAFPARSRSRPISPPRTAAITSRTASWAAWTADRSENSAAIPSSTAPIPTPVLHARGISSVMEPSPAEGGSYSSAYSPAARRHSASSSRSVSARIARKALRNSPTSSAAFRPACSGFIPPRTSSRTRRSNAAAQSW